MDSLLQQKSSTISYTVMLYVLQYLAACMLILIFYYNHSLSRLVLLSNN